MGEQKPPIRIPYKSLSSEAFIGIIEEFILREGTDYGTPILTLEEKVARVKAQIDKGYAAIVFDPNTESCTLLKKDEFKRLGVKDEL